MADSYVCSGATMKCTMGDQSAKLTVLPNRTVILCGKPMANISDHASMVNLAPFGKCRSLAYPATAAATAAALGTLTPMPCVHNTPLPWAGGKSDYLIKNQPALLKSCKCTCMWGGIISITDDGQKGEGTQWLQKSPKEKKVINNVSKNEMNNGLYSEKKDASITEINHTTTPLFRSGDDNEASINVNHDLQSIIYPSNQEMRISNNGSTVGGKDGVDTKEAIMDLIKENAVKVYSEPDEQGHINNYYFIINGNILNSDALPANTIVYNITKSAAKHLDDFSRLIPIPLLDETIQNPMEIVPDPQGTEAKLYYSIITKRKPRERGHEDIPGAIKEYRLEVLYHSESNTIMHFMYTDN